MFDAGRSIRALTLGLGGAFVDLLGEDGMGASLALQPLARIDEETERAWACDWLVALLSRAHVALDTSRKEEIWRALGVLCERPQRVIARSQTTAPTLSRKSGSNTAA